jgi:hypothetical protein
MWIVNYEFKENGKVYKRGDIIRRRKNWPNFDGMVNTGTLILKEDPEQPKDLKIVSGSEQITKE